MKNSVLLLNKTNTYNFIKKDLNQYDLQRVYSWWKQGYQRLLSRNLLNRGICFSRPSAPGPITFISAGFDFLSVCVVKCLCATLIKHICEFSIHKY